MNKLEIANFFWDGELTLLEKKCIQSFVDCGFKVKLWSYTNIELPNVESCDANLVLSRDITLKQELSSKSERAATLAAFSDYFRYKVVAKFGGWWFDTDCFCLKDVNDFIKSAEGKSAIAGIQHFDYNHPHNVACGAFWMNEQTSNKLVDEFEKVISSLNGEPQTFGFYGPEFFTNFIKNNGYYNDMLPISAFYAIHWDECDLIVYPEKLTPAAIKTEKSHLVHIWTTPFKEKGIDKNAPIHGSFLYYLYNMGKRNRLVSLFSKYNLDKLVNKYDKLYVELFKDNATEVKNFLEVGIGTTDAIKVSNMAWYKNNEASNYQHGNSLRAWRDYFVNANIYGVDVDCGTVFTEDRIKTFCSSSFDADNMNNIMAEIGEMDVIIDDGLHTLEGNLQTLQILFPYLKEGGVYVIEDVNQENDWFVDDLLQDPRFLEVAKDYTVHDGFAHSFTRIIVIRK